MIRRFAAGVTSLSCITFALWLAWHHPLSATLACGTCLVLALAAWWRPARWPLLVLPLLPLLGLMPWSGWVVVEEMDLVVLAVAAGAYLRLAQMPPLQRDRRTGVPMVAWTLMTMLTLVTLMAMARGVADAGGLQWGWWQGYREPLNSVRLAKPVIEVLLLLPLWRFACGVDGSKASQTFTTAMLLCLTGTALGVLWERLAFTGLLNFSTDYRATGLFWEMHVGGAALDAVLALTMPFAGAALAEARGGRRWLLAATTLALGAYASLVTFSRIVYVAVPAGLLLWWLLRWRQAGRFEPKNLLSALALVMATWAAAAWLFPVAGYRGQLTLLGAIVVMLPLPEVLRSLPMRARWAAAGLGLPAVLAVVAATVQLGKGAYEGYAMAWLAALACWWSWRGQASRWMAMGVVTASVAVVGAVVAVCWHWGGGVAADRAGLIALSILAFMGCLAATSVRPWPPSLRWQGQVLIVLTSGLAVVAVFGGGAYMTERLATTTQDRTVRVDHWRQSLDLLRTDNESLFGLGLGRYPAQQAMSGLAAFQTGDYRLTGAPGEQALLLTSGSHIQGWGEVFRVSQRITAPPPGPLKVRLKAKPDGDLTVHVEVCEKHLLYTEACAVAKERLKPAAPPGQAVELELQGARFDGGPWYAPRLVVFSVAVESTIGRVAIDDVSLTTFDGGELLVNGNFEAGLARWFFSSDRYHMPWHAKNLAVHLWFEQGLIGLAVFGLTALIALVCCSVGLARTHGLAPALAGALVGVLVVGAVDSLLDMPRVAFLLLLVFAVMLSLGPGRSRAVLCDAP